MTRIIVIGSSCSGKSTFSQQLAEKYKIKYIELDQFHWLPNWQERSDKEFIQLVDQATLADTWVMDGNYSKVRDITWPRATQIIWLNHPFHVVLYRAITRSISRIITRKKLFSDNVESFQKTFLSRDSIILWVLKTYHKKQIEYAKLLNHQHLNIIELKGQSQVNDYLDKCP